MTSPLLFFLTYMSEPTSAPGAWSAGSYASLFLGGSTEPISLGGFVVPSASRGGILVGFVSPSASVGFFLPSLLITVDVSDALGAFKSLSRDTFATRCGSSLPGGGFDVFGLVSVFYALQHVLLGSMWGSEITFISFG